MLTLVQTSKGAVPLPFENIYEIFLVCVCHFTLNFRHCNYSQYCNDSMSNLHDNYDLKIIPSKILIPYIMTDFSPLKMSGWKRIAEPGGTSVLSSVNT